MDELEYGNRTADKPSSIDTRRPSMHTARSLRRDRARAKAQLLRSDRARVLLGPYVATELEPSPISGTSGKLGFSYFPNLNGNRQCKFWFPQFGARRRGDYGLFLLMATKRLIKTMSGYMKDKLAALTAPMAKAYANAVVFNEIENLVATFCHRKSTKTRSRFLPVNTKGNNKIYPTP
ncbi:hypothetical protein F2Q69_00059642 [Brassica cretica]|uniref:Uncharacterized protein n=1 Tax=Brassica cretica TaxID=69181 RepID=A0A8S9RBN4_BRACR|nr:hypothetical protein F2Q69_00059642 [Brassica cretica]